MKISKYRALDAAKWVASYAIIAVVVLFAIFPLYYVVLLSFSKIPSISNITISSMIPNFSTFTLSAYQAVAASPFFMWLANSLILAFGTVIVAVLVAFIAGVALARLHVPGKKALIISLYILTFFPFTSIVIPVYLGFAHLRLLNNFLGLILIYSSGTAIFGAYMAKIFIDSVPKDYEEAAMVDGESRFRALFTILFRIARPVVVFLALIAFIGAYTDYAVINVLVTHGSLYTLMLGLYHVSATASGSQTFAVNLNIFAAFSILMGLPIIVLYIVFQKYLTQMYSVSGIK